MRGFKLFPVEHRGKRPLIEDWPNQASSDPERIQSWQRRWPNCNWGVVTGPASGIFILDIDGEDGLTSLQELIREQGEKWLETLGVKTYRGSHLYFECPDGVEVRCSVKKIAKGIDVRGVGGYAVIPPSVHSSGEAYRWLNDESDAPIAPAPDWLVKKIADAARVSSTDPTTGCDSPIEEGQRNSVLTSLAGAMRRRGMSPEAIEAALLAENASRCVPPLPEDEVRAIARSVSRYQPGGTSTGQPDHESAGSIGQWPKPMEPAAISGLPGEFLNLVSPETEADPAALLISYLVTMGPSLAGDQAAK